MSSTSTMIYGSAGRVKWKEYCATDMYIQVVASNIAAEAAFNAFVYGCIAHRVYFRCY